MAKKKGADRKPGAGRVSVVHLLGPAEEREWLTLLHERTHIPKTTIVRLALAEWAERNGHPKPPKGKGAR
jgi:hypothetical protein